MSMCPECYQTRGHRNGCPEAPDEWEPCRDCDETGDSDEEFDPPCVRCREAKERCYKPCETCRGAGGIGGAELEAARAGDRADAIERDMEARREGEDE